MTLKQLQVRAAYWQERLNLREWRIEVAWGKKADMTDCVGRCRWHAEEQVAWVELRKQDKEKEATLVHELLHVVLQGHLEEVPEYDVHFERALNKIASGLLAA